MQKSHDIAQNCAAAAVGDQCLRTHHPPGHMAGKGRQLGLMLSEARLGLLLFVWLASVIRVRRWLKQFEHLAIADRKRSEEHTSELQSHSDLVCRLLLEKKKE